ncbi:MAG: ABC transporter permease [Caldilinea sp.]|jgi:peptide/nickel transport system permease protein|nr:ABC transporter permease [Caldilinea sp.]
MLRYTLYRLLLFVPLLWGLSVVVFVYIHLIPGDPVQAMVGPSASQEFVAQLREEFGLNRPLLVQYVDWISGLPAGDLGITFRSRQPIAPLLLARIPATLELALAGLLIALLVGLPSGILAGLFKNSPFDHLFSIVSLAGYSMPLFWLGTLLMVWLGVNWKVLPSQGYVPFTQDPLKNLQYLVLPAFSLGLGLGPYIGRMARAAVIEALQEQYVNYAHAKGLRMRTVVNRYVLRNAMISLLVVFGLNIGFLLSGQIVIEELFNWPGAGRLIVRAVLERDYFMIQASVLIYASIFLAINLLVELLHAYLDPRVQLK